MVLTPAVVKSIKVRYVYKLKYIKDESIKKYKTRLVTLDSGQVPGMDVFKHFCTCGKEYHCWTLVRISLFSNMHFATLTL